MTDLASVHERLDAIGNEHDEPSEDRVLGPGSGKIAELVGVDPEELKADARERVKPALTFLMAAGRVLPHDLAGVLIVAYIDGFLAGAAWRGTTLDA